MAVSQEQKARYELDGYLLLPGLIPLAVIDRLEQQFLRLVKEVTGESFLRADSPELARHLLANREQERQLYDGIRRYPWLIDFGCTPEIVQAAASLIGEPSGILSKIPFRLDLPGLLREVAVWHQDFFYVGGNQEIITAWVPLQDTPYSLGCLMVMPGSHRLGALEHDREVLGKRHFPSSIFDREVRYVEMQRGDLLLFHSLLLHSSGVNISSHTRYSVQARYSALSAPTAPSMGELLTVKRTNMGECDEVS